MLAPTGTPVRAPVDGEVTYLTGPRGGLQFELWGDDDTRYIGTHLDDSGARGQVEAGDIIGYVGTSGNEVAVPHLHFEVHPDDGAAMNPYPVLRAACR
jgi:murein DD-endopeptidase MepM/ murein hydrolase activator NlpD